jgi:hypothetical protein
MTPPRFVRIAVIWILALLAAGGVAVSAIPMLSQFFVALLNDPRNLPALEGDARVHYEPAAKARALEAAALLPAAVARVTAAQGRPFARWKKSVRFSIVSWATYSNIARRRTHDQPAWVRPYARAAIPGDGSQAPAVMARALPNRAP